MGAGGGGTLSECLFQMAYQPGVLATLVPSVIERRPRCGLFGASGLSHLGESEGGTNGR